MRSRGTPRIANRLLRRVRDWAIVHDLETVHPDDVKEALALYQIDTEGLDTVCEPYLVREGFLVRTPKGRVATRKAWEHLGLVPDESQVDVSNLA